MMVPGHTALSPVTCLQSPLEKPGTISLWAEVYYSTTTAGFRRESPASLHQRQ